jgi:type IV pilus assembly protein PilC
MNFAYVAKNRIGQEVTGFLAATSMDDVVNQLHAQGMSILHVAEDRSAQSSSWRDRLASLVRGGTSTRNLALFSRQLSTVLESGIPLTRGLRGIVAEGGGRNLQRAVRDVCSRIERGESLSEAMSAHPAIFNKMYMSMIRAGERAGTLDAVVDHLAVYLEKLDAIQNKVRAALAYPIFIICFAVVAFLVMLIYIVPTFEGIYQELAVDLPAFTQLVINVSQAIRYNAPMTLGLAVGVLLLLMLWARTRPGRFFFDGLWLRMPIFGSLVRKAIMSRFARTFGILLRSGLPLLDALDLVKDATGNAVIERSIDRARQDIARGAGITESFRRAGQFPEMVLQMMSTGEESGEIDEMLIKTSDFYDRQVEAAVQGLSSLIEPVMIVIVGAIVFSIVLSMWLPIFYLGDAIMRGGYNL